MTHPRRRSGGFLCLATLAVVAALGCGREEDRAVARQPPAAVPRDTAPAAPPASPSRADSASGLDPSGEWVVTPYRVGPIGFGSLTDALPHLQPIDTVIGGGCEYARPRGGPGELSLMVVGDEVVRVDVMGGPTATAEGARIGDSEARILELYPSARREPHAYTDGSYLVAIPDAPGDTVHRYLFETDGAVVTRYRAGVHPPVAYVEGCL